MTQVFLVGAGPGDPELLTLKALRLLQAAEVVLYDSLVDPKILAMIGPGASADRCRQALRPPFRLPGRNLPPAGGGSAQTGRRVVRLKGGDPMIFGRASEEMDALAQPESPSRLSPASPPPPRPPPACSALSPNAGCPRSLHFLTGHGAENGLPAHDWVSLAKSGGTLVVYMGGQTLPGLSSHFIAAGMSPDMPAIAVERASLPDQRTLHGTIATLPAMVAAAAPSGPVLVLIGEALEASSVEDILARAAR